MALSSVQRKHLAELSGEQLYCKARRRHIYPPMVPGRPMPRGIRVERRDGIYEISETCTLCGRTATRSGGRNGVIDYSTAPRYSGGGPNYLAPKGADMSLAMYQDEYAVALKQSVVDAAKLAAVEQTEERRTTRQRMEELRQGARQAAGVVEPPFKPAVVS